MERGERGRQEVVVRFDRVSLSYGRRRVLEGASFTVEGGKVVAIIGPSGAGKSSILKLIMGLIRPTAGRIEVFGVEPYLANHDGSLRGRIGLVFQEGALFDSLTVYENVEFYLRYVERVPPAQRRRRVMEVLEKLGIEEAAGQMPNELSGGMKKRVALARTLIFEPELLLYDEPTTGLDPLTTEVVDQLIVETNRRLGLTSIVVTHSLDTVMEVADEVLMLSGGKINQVGSPEKLLTSEDPRVKAFTAGLRRLIAAGQKGSPAEGVDDQHRH